MSVVAGLSVALAWGLWRPPANWVIRSRLGARSQWAAPKLSRSLLWAVVPAIITAIWMLRLPWAIAVVAVTLGGVGVFALGQIQRARVRRQLASIRAETTEMIEVLAASVRAGMTPRLAVRRWGQEFPVAQGLRTVADTAGDVAISIQAISRQPGRSALAAVASAWTLAEQSGIPLSVVLDRVATTARENRELDRDVQSSVAPARSTARMMAALPAMGLVLSSGMGVNPMAMLTSELLPAVSVAIGIGLACVGVVWIDGIADRAESA